MNVIFLDFDGVIDTAHCNEEKQIEEKIKILSEITKEYNCKIVIEASAKLAINDDLTYDSEWLDFVFSMFKKYGIEWIGRTPSVTKQISETSYLDMWKEDEIILYLLEHPEVEHFCIIDDDDYYEYTHHKTSDLQKLYEYLVKTKDYLDNPLEEGLLMKHKEEVGEILKKENKYRK